MFETIKEWVSRPRRQELWCHNCENYVQFTIDEALDGNHVIECPKCNHEHCRVVRNGRITDIRWDQRNGAMGMVWNATNTTYAAASTFTTASSTTDVFLYAAWTNTTNAS